MASTNTPLILATNDDGIDAPGLNALTQELAKVAQVVTVAPAVEQSATSRRITLRRPLRLEQRGEGRFAVDGTPTDCVMFAICRLLEKPPALVVSGINNGPNLGENIYYSGTVAAAAEGAKYGVPAIAVSVNQRVDINYDPAVRIAAGLVRKVLSDGLPKGIVLNVNVPAAEIKGFAITHQCKKISRNLMIETLDPWGRPCYWMHEDVPEENAEQGSDYAAIRDGRLSITPLHFDHTAHDLLSLFSEDYKSFDPKAWL